MTRSGWRSSVGGSERTSISALMRTKPGAPPNRRPHSRARAVQYFERRTAGSSTKRSRNWRGFARRSRRQSCSTNRSAARWTPSEPSATSGAISSTCGSRSVAASFRPSSSPRSRPATGSAITRCQVGETAILSAAGRHFACSVKNIRYLEGSYDRHLVREWLSDEDITFRRGGRAPMLVGSGLGVSISPAKLDAVTVRKERLLADLRTFRASMATASITAITNRSACRAVASFPSTDPSHGGWVHPLLHTVGRHRLRSFFLDRRGAGLKHRSPRRLPVLRRLMDDVAEFLRDLRLTKRGCRSLSLAFLGAQAGRGLSYRAPALVDAIALMCPGLCPRVRPSLIERLLIARSASAIRRSSFRFRSTIRKCLLARRIGKSSSTRIATACGKQRAVSSIPAAASIFI